MKLQREKEIEIEKERERKKEKETGLVVGDLGLQGRRVRRKIREDRSEINSGVTGPAWFSSSHLCNAGIETAVR